MIPVVKILFACPSPYKFKESPDKQVLYGGSHSEQEAPVNELSYVKVSSTNQNGFTTYGRTTLVAHADYSFTPLFFKKGKWRNRHCKSSYISADSYGRYLPTISGGVDLAVSASSCM
jgi:hypothetical protein